MLLFIEHCEGYTSFDIVMVNILYWIVQIRYSLLDIVKRVSLLSIVKKDILRRRLDLVNIMKCEINVSVMNFYGHFKVGCSLL